MRLQADCETLTCFCSDSSARSRGLAAVSGTTIPQGSEGARSKDFTENVSMTNIQQFMVEILHDAIHILNYQSSEAFDKPQPQRIHILIWYILWPLKRPCISTVGAMSVQ